MTGGAGGGVGAGGVAAGAGVGTTATGGRSGIVGAPPPPQAHNHSNGTANDQRDRNDIAHLRVMLGTTAQVRELFRYVGKSWPRATGNNPVPLERYIHEGQQAAGSMSRERFESEAMPHLKSLYGAAYRMTSNSHDAEDLVQETFLRAFRAFHTFTPGTNIRAWLHTILQRARTDAFRRASRSPKTVELPEDGPMVPPPQAKLETGAEDLERALGALPEVFRMAVVLRDVEDLSYQEIAGVLGVPIGTVMSRLHRGRALLRESLQAGRP
jgi:RNA polymerase sigma-70 factor (ECF subfamily)